MGRLHELRSRIFRLGVGTAHLLIFVLTFAPTALSCAPSTELESKLEMLAAEAREAQSARDYGRAAKCYEEILKLGPALPEMHSNLGLMHHLLGKYPEAIHDFEEALRQKPDLFVANLFLGLDLAHTNQHQQAIPFLLRAYHVNPSSVDTCTALAQTYLALNDYDQSVEWYQRVTELDPQNVDAWYGLGVSHLRLQEMAVSRFGKAGLNSPYFQLLLAQSLEQHGNLNDAVGAYKKVLASKIDSACVHSYLGYALALKGDLEAAENEFTADLGSGGSCQAAHLGLARVDFERGDFEEGLANVRRAWNADHRFVEENAEQLWRGVDPPAAETWKRKFAELQQKGAEAEMAGFLITSMEGLWQPSDLSPSTQNTTEEKSSFPANDSAARLWSEGHYTRCAQKLKAATEKLSTSDLQLLAQCSYYSGDYSTVSIVTGRILKSVGQDPRALFWQVKAEEKLAVRALIQAGMAAPQSPRVHLLLGDLYRDAHNYTEAETEYQKVLQLKPESVAAHFGLAATYYLAVRFDEAALEAQKVLDLKPGDPDASFLLAETLVSKRQYAEATPYLNAALRGQPNTLPRVHALRSKVYAAQGQNLLAVNELKQALTDDPDGSLHFQLSQLYSKLGDTQAAEAAMQKSETIRKAKAERDQEKLESVER
jgi:tetratricopeptide (TPR) repeat protein